MQTHILLKRFQGSEKVQSTHQSEKANHSWRQLGVGAFAGTKIYSKWKQTTQKSANSLHPTGELDKRTQHRGCVIIASSNIQVDKSPEPVAKL